MVSAEGQREESDEERVSHHKKHKSRHEASDEERKHHKKHKHRHENSDEEQKRHKKHKHESKKDRHERHRHEKRKKHRHKERKDERKRHKKRKRSSSSDGDSSDSSEPFRKRVHGSPTRSRSSSSGIGPPLPPPPGPLPLPPAMEYPVRSARPFTFLQKHRGGGTSKPKVNGGGLNAYLRCATCGVESSGETAFLQHLCGRAHQKANGGRTGFAGLVPNSMGKIPRLVNPALRSAAMRMGQSPDGTACAPSGGTTAAADLPPPPWAPPPRTVVINAAAEGELQRALQRTAALGASAAADAVRSRDDLFSRMSGDNSRANRPLASGGGGALSGTPPPPSQQQQVRRRAARPPPPPPAAVRHGGPFASVRCKLPVASARDELLAALSEPACVVEGETGSGKTTQVPQYLLVRHQRPNRKSECPALHRCLQRSFLSDSVSIRRAALIMPPWSSRLVSHDGSCHTQEQAAERGERINVICSQPRRISAIGVAERVAAERGERVGAGAVGYAVRGESRQSDETCLLFCTTGVLLRMLEDEPSLASVTHVLIDEVMRKPPPLSSTLLRSSLSPSAACVCTLLTPSLHDT